MIVKPEISEGDAFYDHGYQSGDDAFGNSMAEETADLMDHANASYGGDDLMNSSHHSGSTMRSTTRHSRTIHSTDLVSHHTSHTIAENHNGAATAQDGKHQLDFARLSFFGRHQELQKLHRTYEKMILGELVSSKKSPPVSAAAAATAISTSSTTTTTTTTTATTATDSILHSLKPSTNSVAAAAAAAAAESSVHSREGLQDAGNMASPVPVVLVTGPSGTGKSRLIQKFLHNVSQLQFNPYEDPSLCQPCTILQGKFDYNHQRAMQPQQQQQQQRSHGIGDPFGGIVRALTTYCYELIQKDDGELDQVRQRIQAVIGKQEARVLTTAIPALSILFEDVNESSPAENTNAAEPAKKRLSLLDDSDDEEEDHGDDQSTMTDISAWTLSAATYRSLNAHTAPSLISHPSNSLVVATLWNRWTYVFRTFFRALSAADNPVILFLDDLQWASQASLELLSSLLLDNTTSLQSNFLLVGAIRQQHGEEEAYMQTATRPANNGGLSMHSARSEVGTQQHLYEFVHKLKEQQSICSIPLATLSSSETAQFIAHALERPSSECEGLAKALYKKTRGNFFYLLQTLQELERKHILVFSLISFQWEWNFSDESQLEKTLSDNVVEAVQAQIQSKSVPLQQALAVAAYTRSTFDIDTLLVLLLELMSLPAGISILGDNNHSNNQNPSTIGEDYPSSEILDMPSLTAILEEAVLEGFLINTIGGRSYQFAHDRIQQASHDLIQYGEERNMMRLHIGQKLFELATNGPSAMAAQVRQSETTALSMVMPISNTSNDWMLFCAADHLNSVPTKDHLFMARLNLQVGEKSSKVAALIQAAAYLQKSQICLRKVRDAWKDHYEISLRLARARANVELSLGHFELGHSLGLEVLEHAKTLYDKLPTYLAMATAFGRQNRHGEALHLIRTVLWLMDEYPKRFYTGHTARGMMAARSHFSKRTDAEILSLPLKSDPHKIYAMKFMVQAGIRAFLSNNQVEWMLLMSRTLRLTFQHGLCENSAMGFCNYAVWLASTGNQDGALRFARLARKTLVPTKGKALEGWVLYLASSIIHGWSQPHTQVISNLQRGHTSAMETGEFEVGFFNWHMCNLHAYTAGYPLAPISSKFSAMHDQAKLYGLVVIINAVKEQRDFLKIMTGETYLNWKEVESFGNAPNLTDRFHLINACLTKLQLAVYFGKPHTAYFMSKRLWEVSGQDNVYNTCVLRNLFSGLAMAAMYRDQKRKKYLSRLRQIMLETKELSQKRGLNSLHRSLLLEAEWKSFKLSNSKKVKSAYDVAIMCALKSGHIQDAGLGCELAGEHFLRLKEHEFIGEYFTKSIELYQEWGAAAKVKDLERRRIPWLDRSRVDRAKQATKDGLVISRAGFSRNPIADHVGAGTEQRQQGVDAVSKDKYRSNSVDTISRKSGSQPFSITANSGHGMTAASMVAGGDDDNVSFLSNTSQNA